MQELAGHTVPMVNATVLQSEIGERLGKENPFSVTYFCDGPVKQFSLRSNGKVDVSAIAKSFGGGGHVSAAGYRVVE
jgi:nanoRNase/pAp phosphatase (c-di-AMP/oligoRNAs hydrolase)